MSRAFSNSPATRRIEKLFTSATSMESHLDTNGVPMIDDFEYSSSEKTCLVRFKNGKQIRLIGVPSTAAFLWPGRSFRALAQSLISKTYQQEEVS